MNPNKLLQNIRLGQSPFDISAITTLAVIAISIYCLSSGWFIIFQNLFYFPIIITCMFYTKKGFVFSVILSFIYFFLIIAFTGNSAVIIQALIRLCIFIGVAGVITFLSIKRKRAEEALKESKIRYRAVADFSYDWEYWINPDRHFLYCSPSCERITGYRVEEFEKDPKLLISIVHPDDREQFIEHFINISQDRCCYGQNFRIITRNGQESWIAHACQPVYSGDGQYLGQRASNRDITGQKQTEKALRESEARHSSMIANISNISDVTGIIGIDGIIKYKSPNIEKLFGWLPSDLVGTDSWLTVHPDDLELIQKVFFTLLEKDNSSKTVEYRYKCKDGSYKPIELTAINLTGDPVINGLLLNYHDITERKKAEETLRESEERYRTVANFTYDWEYWMTPDGSLTYISPSCERITGYGMEEFQQDPGLLVHIVHTDDRDRFKEHLPALNVMENKDCYEQNIRILTRNGEERWLAHACQPVYSHSGQYLGRRASNRDITMGKQADELLRKSEERLRDIIFSMADWVWEVDENGVYTYSSNKSYDFFGISDEDIVGKTPFDFMPHDEAKRVAEIFSKITANKGPIKDLENLNIKQNGESIYLLTNGVPILDKEGNFKGYRGVDKDITGRKQAEKEQKKLQDQLFHAQKMESVGRLAGGVAHDFNNIMGIITGYTELLMMDTEPDNPVYSKLQQILNSTERATALTRQLLAFARKQVSSPKILDINETVANMLKMLQMIIGENIEIICIPGHDLWKVRIDPVQIEQIMANLTVNSRDAISNTGSITLETGNVVLDSVYASDHAEILPGEYVLMTVSDTGIGMSKEIKEHIFEPFFTTKEIGKGTGLGLSTVYGIVHQNNGFINVYSEEGKGTTFKIYLPRFKSDIAESTEEKVSEKLQKGTETLLLTEDEEHYLLSSKMILERLGYTVLTSYTPEKAIHISEQYRGDIDLLITDVIMPGMNGKELLEKIHKIRPGLKCLYMSGYTVNVIAHHGVLDEGVHFLEKPFSVKTIAEKVREVLDKG